MQMQGLKNLFFTKVQSLSFRRTFSFGGLEKVSVIYSKSNCAYENLAFENYLYENKTFTENDRVLFLWRNENCIVIGRHQNPWKEVNLQIMDSKNTTLCRRMSGGGSVYHDLGNVNFTFFTSKENYNRKENLDFIIRTLSDGYQINLVRNEKDDIILDGKYKVSGTAAKLGLKNCYHHCTLLCCTNIQALTGLLKNPFGENLKTNATESIKSITRNLFTDDFDFTKLLNLFTANYYKTYSIDDQADIQDSILEINPRDIPDVVQKSRELRSWEWTYGESPKFTLANQFTSINGRSFEIVLTVNKGILESFVSNGNSLDSLSQIILESLIGTKFDFLEILSNLLQYSQETESLFYCKQIIAWFDK